MASHFRDDFYACLRTRRDELSGLTDALLRADGSVTTPVDLALLAERRRGHGALYAALSNGRIDVARLRRMLTAVPQRRAADDRLVLTADVSNWLWLAGPTSADRLFCHAALETGRTSWYQLLGAVRLGPEDDGAEGTAPRPAASSRTSSSAASGARATPTS